MHLTNVRIRNFRSFEDLDLHLHPGVNIIYGAPNIDKFGILDAIAIGISGYFSGKYPDLARHIHQGDIRIVASTSANPFQAFSCAYPSEIHCEVQVDESKYPLTRTRTEHNEKAVAMWPNGVSIANVNTKPLLRFLNMPGIDTKRSVLAGLNPKKSSAYDLAYDKCLKSDLNANAIRKWLSEMEEERRAYPNASAQYDAFKALVSSVVCNTTEVSGLDLAYSTQHKDVIVSMDGECLPISHWGSGHQALLWLAMDLAHRTVILNPDVAESGNVEGIVLLHELDVHLHPDWQWNILGALTKTYPNVQFIVTTDSPILMSSHKSGDMLRIFKRLSENSPSFMWVDESRFLPYACVNIL